MSSNLIPASARLRRGAFTVWDALCWCAAGLLVIGTRYDFRLSEVLWAEVGLYLVLCLAAQGVLGWSSKVYQGRYQVGSFEEGVRLGLILTTIWVVLAPVLILLRPGMPKGLVLLTPPIALLGMFTGRLLVRMAVSRVQPALAEDALERVLIYGAGATGAGLARRIDQDRETPFVIQGFIDDDHHKRHLQVGRHRVLGNGTVLLEQAKRRGVQTVIIAIPTASPEFLRRVATEVEDAGLKVLVLPSLEDMLTTTGPVPRLDTVDVADLLGRTQVETDMSQIAGYLNSKTVLVTGAGGSIGSEIARQVHAFGPRELVLLDRDESGLHGVQLSIYGQGLLDTPDMVLCDIRDRDALDRVFAYHQPQVVFHAAALKHLPMLEQYPTEAWKTNVLGTLNVLSAAQSYGVQHFVNISTDKAADPTSILGRSKRLAERLTAWYADQYPGVWISVRFGNVLGSRGSMLHTFGRQIEDGKPVTVTHPDITRYFMTISEASQLTLQAGAVGARSGALVLDMGTPVRIYDVATRLIKHSGKNIPIKFTGLRPGEKLHEVLFSHNEQSTGTSHPLIDQVPVPALPPEELHEHHFITTSAAPAPADLGAETEPAGHQPVASHNPGV